MAMFLIHNLFCNATTAYAGKMLKCFLYLNLWFASFASALHLQSYNILAEFRELFLIDCIKMLFSAAMPICKRCSKGVLNYFCTKWLLFQKIVVSLHPRWQHSALLRIHLSAIRYFFNNLKHQIYVFGF